MPFLEPKHKCKKFFGRRRELRDVSNGHYALQQANQTGQSNGHTSYMVMCAIYISPSSILGPLS